MIGEGMRTPTDVRRAKMT